MQGASRRAPQPEPSTRSLLAGPVFGECHPAAAAVRHTCGRGRRRADPRASAIGRAKAVDPPREEAIIDFLITGPLGRAELRAQAAPARVVATCSCDCPSVWIDSDPSAPAPV